jgi:hypothetical protein
MDSQKATALEISLAKDHCGGSFKASLPAGLGLKEKSKSPDLKTVQVT